LNQENGVKSNLEIGNSEKLKSVFTQPGLFPSGDIKKKMLVEIKVLFAIFGFYIFFNKLLKN
jgi:hypothetical protein